MKTPTDYQEKQDYLSQVRRIKTMWEERCREEYKAGIVVGLFMGAAIGVIFAAALFNFVVLQ